jgi:hypothetical protein
MGIRKSGMLPGSRSIVYHLDMDGVLIRLPGELVEDVDQIASAEQRSRSNTVLRLVTEALVARRINELPDVAPARFGGSSRG